MIGSLILKIAGPIDKRPNVFNSLDLDTSCVFELRFNGFSYREISQLLDISISSVDSKLSRARRFMKNL